jgi:hypothetical protein
MRKFLGVITLFIPALVFGQGVSRNDSILKASSGQSGTVRVCTSAATGTPCSPLASIYSDVALTIPIVGSIVTTDVNGNYSYYAAEGTYKEQTISGNSTFTRTITLAALVPALATTATTATNLSGGTVTASAVNGECNPASAIYSTGSTTGGLAEAITAGCKTIKIPANTVLHVTTGLGTVVTTALHINGSGDSSEISIDAAFNLMTLGMQYFRMSNLVIRMNTASDRTSNFLFSDGAQIGHFDNVTVIPNVATVSNGTFFQSTGNGTTAGAYWFNHVFVLNGGNWKSCLSIVNSNAQTAASWFMDSFSCNGTFSDAGFVIDGFIDTWVAGKSGGDGRTGTGPLFWFRNTVAAPADPRWLFCSDCLAEAVGSTAVVIDAARQVSYQGYAASANVGVAIGATALGADIHNTVFTNIAHQGVTVANGAVWTGINDNFFDDVCNGTDATYNAIDINGGAKGVTVTGNKFRLSNGSNKCNYGVAVNAAGSDNLIIGPNDMSGATFRVASILNSATGAVQDVVGNGTAANTYKNATMQFNFSASALEYYSNVPGAVLTKTFWVSPNATGSNSSINTIGQISYKNSGGNGFFLTGTPTGSRVITTPDTTGTISVAIASSCGTTTTCANTTVTGARTIYGSVALSSGTPSTAVVSSITAFTSTASYVCTLTNQTNAANNILKVVNTSTSSFTITGPNTITDTIGYICIGN